MLYKCCFIWLVVCLTALAPARAAVAGSCPAPAGPLPTTTAGEADWHQRAYARRTAVIGQRLGTESFDAIALGDSIVQRWPDDMLRQATGLMVLNAGILGNRTQYVLRQFGASDWSRQRPKMVLLLIGTNNLADSPPCDVFWGIRADIDAIHQHFPGAQVAVISLLPRGGQMMEFDTQIRQINAELAQSAAAGGFIYVNAHDAFLCGHVTPCALMTPPGWVHPSAAGYEALDPLVHEALATHR